MVLNCDDNERILEFEGLCLIDDVVPFQDGGLSSSPPTRFASPSAFAAFVFGSPPALSSSITPIEDDEGPSNNRPDVVGEKGGDPAVSRQLSEVAIQESTLVKLRYRLWRTRHC
jgi:hypothetical protein